MSRRTAFIALAAAILAAAATAPAMPGRAAPQRSTPRIVQQTTTMPQAARAVSGTAPAVAHGDTTVVAWLQDHASRWRVIGTAGSGVTPTPLGPAEAGSDGAPAATAGADGAVWVMASRAANGVQRLWLQRHAGGAWGLPAAGPRARRFDHHPSLAAVPGTAELWAAWIGEDDERSNDAMLYAARFNGVDWTATEALPRTAGAPMAPALAIDATGAPVIAWAASDGQDAEIWVSARRAGRWSAPRALTRNQVPDIAPSMAAVGGGLAVAWITYTDTGYVPVAAAAPDTGAWGEPRVLDTTPGSHPLVLDVDDAATVMWRRLEDGPAGGTIVARRLDGTRAGAEPGRTPLALAATSGSPFRVSRAGDGRLLLAFTRPGGTLGFVEGRSDATDPLAALAAAAAARYGPPRIPLQGAAAVLAPAADHVTPLVPESYTAFGDSITNGVLYDPDRQDSPGYRAPLQQMLRAFFGSGTVFNAGVDGESTVDGVGRIDNTIRSQVSDAILIMEGTNDILAAIDIEVTAFNLRRMVQRSYEEAPDILPFLAQLPPRLDPGPEGFDGPGNGRIDELNAMLPEIAFEEGAVIVDMNAPLDGNRELMSNHVHPSAAGYEVMAEQWYDAIRPVVLDRTNRGDVDGSGRVDGIDLVRLALAFGAIDGEQRYDDAADVNGDGIVDGFDLDLLIEFFGRQIGGESS